MEEFIRSGLKKIGLWALVAISVLAVIAVRAHRPKTTLDSTAVFGHVYFAGEDAENHLLNGTGMVVRLEQDMTLLLRSPGSVWANMGIMAGSRADRGAVEAWETKDGAYRVLVKAEGVFLEVQESLVALSRVDTLSVGVNGDSGSQFLTPQWYPAGEEVNPEHLTRCSAEGEITLVLNIEEYLEELTVVCDGKEQVLPRDRSRTFLLDVAGEAGETKVVEVPYGAGSYRFALVFG